MFNFYFIFKNESRSKSNFIKYYLKLKYQYFMNEIFLGGIVIFQILNF